MVWGIPEAERGQTDHQGSCVMSSASSCTQTYGSSKVYPQDAQGKAGQHVL